MTILEIISLARLIARECVNGLTRAAHYLRSLNLPVEFAVWCLLGR
jgi:hypothetical protein